VTRAACTQLVVCTHHCRSKRHVVFCCGPMQHLRLYRLCSGVSRTRIERSCCLHGHTRAHGNEHHVDSDLTQSWLARASASRMHRSSRITWPGCAYGYVVAICHSLWPESRPVATTRLHAALLCTTHTCVHVSSLAVGMRDAVIRSVRMSFHIGQACMLLHGD